MAIKPNSGFIYFLRETDVLTKEMSPYVKIGRTSKPVDDPVKDRIEKELQTGNPRVITPQASFEVMAVNTVEGHLHAIFSEHRILREWFLLDEDTLAAALKEAEDISARIGVHKEELTQAAELEGQLPEDPELPSSQGHLELVEKYTQAIEERKLAEVRKELKKTHLLLAMGGARGIQDIVRRWREERKPIDKERLESNEPDIYKDCTKEIEEVRRKFTLVRKPQSVKKLDQDLDLRRKQLRDELEKKEWSKEPDRDLPAERTPAFESLHLDYLKSHKDLNGAALQEELLEAQVKATCGLARGIDGLCSWGGELKTEIKFDPNKLKKDYPHLIEEYSLPPQTIWKVKVSDSRSYLAVEASK